MSQLDKLTPGEQARVQHAAWLHAKARVAFDDAMRSHVIADTIGDPIQGFALRLMAREACVNCVELLAEARRVAAELAA